MQRSLSGATWRAGLVALLALVVGVIGARADGGALFPEEEAPSPPVWPESYTVYYHFSVPAFDRLQPHGLRYSVHFARDGGGGGARPPRVAVSTSNGTNVSIAKKGRELNLVPRLDAHTCLVFAAEPGEEGGLADLTALPDMSAGWAYAGAAAPVRGAAAVAWRAASRQGGKDVAYTMLVGAADGAPLRLQQHGREYFSQSHYDDWVVDYEWLAPGAPHASAFRTPRPCRGVRPEPLAGRGRSAPALRAAAVVPHVPPSAVLGGGAPLPAPHAGYDAFLASPAGAARRLASPAEYRARAAAFATNAALVDTHNAAAAAGGGGTHRLALNRFADWTRDEFERAMLPRLARRRAAAARGGAPPRRAARAGAHELPYAPAADPARLPRGVDWRGSGAAGAAGVKDQAACGSCWTFGATAAVEAAWFLATGEAAQLSEQHIMDCSWGYVPGDVWANAACDGGDVDAALGWLVDAGGALAAADYEYKGQDGFCDVLGGAAGGPGGARRNASAPAARPAAAAAIRGYVRVPSGDDAAVMEALHSRGPLAIALDASQPSFAFYASGVYAEPGCKWASAELDHAVVLVGYGDDEATGEPYWLVRNTWGTNWGDGGYVRISRRVARGCGVSADAMYAVADERAAAAARAAARGASGAA